MATTKDGTTSPMSQSSGPVAGLAAAGVRVPASTSNLGAGFDSIGLALNRYLRASYEPGPEPLRLERGGELAGLQAPTAHDLLVRTFLAGLAGAGVGHGTGVLRVASEIPVARGLGSSAAAVVAGLRLAAIATGRADSERNSEQVREAEHWEGHPDNVAAALLGGLVGVARDGDGQSHVFRLPVSESLGFAFAAPGVGQSTAASRNVLPRSVGHAQAAESVGRVAALLHGLSTGDPKLLRLGFTDGLHVPHRLPLIPGGEAAVRAAASAGAWAATISGSGTGIIAVCPRERCEQVAASMRGEFEAARGDESCVAFVVEPDLEGAVDEVEVHR